MEQKLENIYEKLKKNPHKFMRIIEKDECIRATFNTLENAINMLINVSEYSYNVNLTYNTFSKEYHVILYLYNI